jgi:hypothetical protein
LEAELTKRYGPGPWLLAFYNNQLVIDHARAKSGGHDLDQMRQFLCAHLRTLTGIMDAVIGTELAGTSESNPIRQLANRGWNQRRSGDVVLLLEPGTQFDYVLGASHGGPFNPDQRIPFIIAGPSVPPGTRIFTPVEVTQIAPTLTALLGISEPNAAFSEPLPFLDRVR